MNFHLTLFKDPITFTNEGVLVLASNDSTDLSGSNVVGYVFLLHVYVSSSYQLALFGYPD
jgi:hypothetical protein